MKNVPKFFFFANLAAPTENGDFNQNYKNVSILDFNFITLNLRHFI